MYVREGWQASDLAVAAARKLIDEQPGDIDLLMIASASQDLIEPATSHIVSAKLGLSAPVIRCEERLQFGHQCPTGRGRIDSSR
jgi:3-oxoacyl-[acyl-carrier-protein] synthase III